jgi:hypothetical protein
LEIFEIAGWISVVAGNRSEPNLADGFISPGLTTGSGTTDGELEVTADVGTDSDLLGWLLTAWGWIGGGLASCLAGDSSWIASAFITSGTLPPPNVALNGTRSLATLLTGIIGTSDLGLSSIVLMMKSSTGSSSLGLGRGADRSG